MIRATLAATLGLAVAAAGSAQPAPDVVAATGGEITILPIAHATLQIRYGSIVILVDPARFTPGAPLPFKKGERPVLPPGLTPQDSIAMWPIAPGQLARFDGMAAPTLVLVTDDHDDHFDAPAIAALRMPATVIVGPAAIAARAPDAITMANGDARTVAGVRLEAIPMYNLRPEPGFTQPFHARGRGNGYVATVGGKRIYVAGDTACTPEVRALRDIDVAFLPMNLPYTMSPDDAAACAKAFKPAIVYPYHSFESDVGTFLRALAATGIDVRVRDWYRGVTPTGR